MREIAASLEGQSPYMFQNLLPHKLADFDQISAHFDLPKAFDTDNGMATALAIACNYIGHRHTDANFFIQLSQDG